MEQRTEATAPPGWKVAVEVDSRLEADLVGRLLAADDIVATVVATGTGDYAVYVAGDDLDSAVGTLDVT